VFGARTLRLSAAVRQWLQLRLRAWQHGQAFEPVQVTPNFLAQLDVAACPVTRALLRDQAGQIVRQDVGQTGGPSSAATIARLSHRAAYAAGNLAMLSVQAECAAAGRDWQDALAMAGRIEAGEAAQIDGLDAAMWTRLAVLMSFCTPLPHGLAAGLPLRALPPNRVRVQNPVQALQVMLTLQFTEAGYARRLLGLAALMPCSETRQAFQIFMHTLLARRLAAGQAPVGAGRQIAPDGPALRQAMEDSWADALVNRRWQRLALRLDAATCERLLQAAARRGLAGRGCQWLSDAQATDGWALASAGREEALAPGSADAAAAIARQAAAADRVAQAAVRTASMPALAAPASSSRRPGSERKRGSQKLAS